jgi:thioredoxin reductase (NADPH)
VLWATRRVARNTSSGRCARSPKHRPAAGRRTRSDDLSTRVLIVGGGPAGYSAALYATRAGLQPICIEGFDAGGQISRSYLVENYPGAPDGTSGADLAARIRDQATKFGARIFMDDVTAVDLDVRPFRVETTGPRITSDAVVIATGSRPRPLGLPGEESLVGRGIAYCALCDGAFFAGQDVVVVGGGNAALGESLAMARVASRVTLVHRRTQFRGDHVVEQSVRANSSIDVLAPYVVTDLVADDDGALCGVKLTDVDTGLTEYRATSGLFVAIGHEPAVGLFQPYVAVSDGHIVKSATTSATTREGVFAAGDVADSRPLTVLPPALPPNPTPTRSCIVLLGSPAPDFRMVTTQDLNTLDQHATLADYRGKWLVLFFYPADFTFVCPTEVLAFNAAVPAFADLDAELLGVSTDGIFAHVAWMEFHIDRVGRSVNEILRVLRALQGPGRTFAEYTPSAEPSCATGVLANAR